jgi:hypothetical protein
MIGAPERFGKEVRSMASTTPPVDDFVFLAGRPPVMEFMGFVKMMAVDSRSLHDGALATEWRAANDRVVELEATEPGWADNPPLGTPPAQMQPILDGALSNPSVQKTYSVFPSSWAMVELDRLIVFQKFINLRYVTELKASLSKAPGPEELAKFAAGASYENPAVQVTTGPNGYTFSSPSSDLRLLEITYVDPGQITGFVSAGVPAVAVAAFVGYSPNFISALQVGNRVILHNGSHRAFALRDLGITHTPCLIQRVSREDELELTGVDDLKAHADRYLKDSRPAVLKDYFDPRLRKIVPVARKQRVVQLQIIKQEGLR